ncbi:hypothetical protein BIT28_02180 [Photobacterium proteolyticum]|uniref:AAA+ ATPase domain-containing protein n=1 Tax=Photobacterium proteolyticum TaxID=1903952 RepID=A0A1Q9GVH5_9GAMM|nr:AAA domain-containing protein [Photobacterium proteolyticum]OLQ79164.1 hypothetical protein BIT28_02180 [Photobacterium proteolyticum]
MDLKKLNIEFNHRVWVKPLSKALPVEVGDIGRLTISSRTQRLQLVIKGQLASIECRHLGIEKDIVLQLSRRNSNLVQVVGESTSKEGEQGIELGISFFNGEVIEFGELDISLDGVILGQATKLDFGDNFSDVHQSLLSGCQLLQDDLDPEYFYLPAILGSAALDELNRVHELLKIEKQNQPNDIKESITNDELLDSQQSLVHNMVLLGSGFQLAITEQKNIDFNFLAAKKLVQRVNPAPGFAVRLIRAKLKFTDMDNVVRLQTLASQQMKELAEKEQGYLNVWDKYGDLEGETLLRKARDVAVIECTPDNSIFDPKEKGLEVSVGRDLRKLLKAGDCLELVNPENLPNYLAGPELSWSDYSTEKLVEYQKKKGISPVLNPWGAVAKPSDDGNDVDDQNEGQEKKKSINNKECMAFDPIKILKVNADTLVIDIQDLPDRAYSLVYSMLGDQIQIERRMSARVNIQNGTSAMPNLGVLIEEDGTLLPRNKKPQIKALTSFVKEKIFPKHPPTMMQEKAISVALNTPDIAIIQGPPGTGKTTVITAIIERLNQESAKDKQVTGSILVSGYQHDAVENLMSRLSINNLPAIKFGKRSGQTEASTATAVKIDHWREQTAQRSLDKNPDLKLSQSYLTLERDYRRYLKTPSDGLALQMIKVVKEFISGKTDVPFLSQIDALHEELTQQSSNSVEMLPYVRALRVTEVGFKDDGSARAAMLKTKLQPFFEAGDKEQREILELLTLASIWKASDPLSFLAELKEMKLDLLTRYAPIVQLKTPKVRKDVTRCMKRCLEWIPLNDNRITEQNQVISEYLAHLEGSSKEVHDTIAEYNVVYGATTQQAEGIAIRQAKVEGKGLMRYDTIIVDEAARTSPRDLMIPMVQAENRIILVGDHRQLPHMVDETVIKKMKEMEIVQEGDQSIEEDHLKHSMFQYLFSRLQQLEKQDGIKRTITLDAQFRSHPLLGQFASEQFYQPYGEAYQSPLPAKLFDQQLQGIESKAALWLDVPYSEQTKERRNQAKSRYRVLEAEKIAEQVKIWIDSEQGKDLSFGVISFYKAQVQEVFKALAKYGITEQIETENSKDWVISQDYAMLYDQQGKPLEERLRIGTVDSFQGMEFDVVLLSMVRTQSAREVMLKQVESPKDQQNVFGHLMSKNRLCVSMTRQKKALVVVGDAALVQTALAKQAIPELQAYHQLCCSDELGGLL